MNKDKALTVGQLIQRLGELELTAKVLVEGKNEEDAFNIVGLIDDDSGAFVILLSGSYVKVQIET